MDATCDDFELHVNVKDVRSRRAARRLPRLTLGRLTPRRLQELLPPADLLTVSICGTPSFVTTMREMYLTMGLPRPLLSTVS